MRNASRNSCFKRSMNYEASVCIGIEDFYSLIYTKVNSYASILVTMSYIVSYNYFSDVVIELLSYMTMYNI